MAGHCTRVVRLSRWRFERFGDVAIDDLSESEKDFCVRMAKERVRVSAGEFMMGALEDDDEAYDREKPRHKVI